MTVAVLEEICVDCDRSFGTIKVLVELFDLFLELLVFELCDLSLFLFELGFDGFLFELIL